MSPSSHYDPVTRLTRWYIDHRYTDHSPDNRSRVHMVDANQRWREDHPEPPPDPAPNVEIFEPPPLPAVPTSGPVSHRGHKGKKSTAKAPAKQRTRVARKRRMPKKGGGGGGRRAGGVPGFGLGSQPTNLMSCLTHYGESLINPFDSPPGCLPHSPAVASGKYKVFARGTMITGTAGFGFVTTSTTCAGGTAIRPMVVHSTTGYAGTTIATIAGTGVITNQSNSPFQDADFGPSGIQCRNVSHGIRIRYAGPELARQGVIVPFEEPNHISITGMGVGQLLSYQQTRTHSNSEDRPWIVVTYSPRLLGEYQYRESANVPLNEDYFLGIVVSGGGAGVAFDYEVFSSFEAIGRTIPNPTPSDADDGLVSRLTSTINELSSTALTQLQNWGSARLERWVVNQILGASSLLGVRGTPHGRLTY